MRKALENVGGICEEPDDGNAAILTENALAGCDMMSAEGRAEALLVYVALRVRVRHGVAVRRASQTNAQAVSNELRSVLLQLDELRRLRRTPAMPLPHFPTLSIYSARYSKGVTVTLRQYFEPRITHSVADVRKLPAKAFDLIIADPPYGFNTNEKPEQLASLYREMVPALIAALRTDSQGVGQLVLCLPDRSYVGRAVWAFVLPDFVSSLIEVEAARQSLRVVHHSGTALAPSKVFSPPYYWDSERALRRRILHFHFSREPLSS
jgi:hypothetical protein